MSEDESRKIFSKNLRYFMNLNNVTQNDLMNDLDLPSATVSSWVNGVRLPRMEKIQMLSNYFGINAASLINDWENDYHESLISNNTKATLFFGIDELSNEEIEEVRLFIEFIKSKRNK